MVNSLSNTCVALKNAESARKKEVVISPASKVIQQILRIFQRHAYIGEFERYDDGRQGKFKIALLGRINECAGLMRLNYKVNQFELLERKLLPAPGLGIIVLTTNEGIMTMKEAEGKHIGGHTLCYIY
ncbi:MAG: 30S ribosomal protein S8 [Candidatus Lokiarchaeota archaeon]|jgi:small subunit ribosomal protein S8|nr:30S ribosomal protein S8 [Candidatus Lokiarchaeota archaeon]